MDEFDDRELGVVLRQRADALTADVIDPEPAYGAVHQRARTRRRWRAATSGVLAAAAAAVGVLVVTSVAGDDEVVRTPATSPVLDTTIAPAPTTTAPSTVATTTTTTVASATPATAVAPSTAAAAPMLTTYDSAGGSISVRLANGAISLAGDPTPAPGFSVRIDDNGPDRVRVRFERDDERSEIRVDLDNGALVPEIIDS